MSASPTEIRQIIRGLRVIEPELWPGERVVWEAKANRYQSKLRAVGAGPRRGRRRSGRPPGG